MGHNGRAQFAAAVVIPKTDSGVGGNAVGSDPARFGVSDQNTSDRKRGNSDRKRAQLVVRRIKSR